MNSNNLKLLLVFLKENSNSCDFFLFDFLKKLILEFEFILCYINQSFFYHINCLRERCSHFFKKLINIKKR